MAGTGNPDIDDYEDWVTRLPKLPPDYTEAQFRLWQAEMQRWLIAVVMVVSSTLRQNSKERELDREDRQLDRDARTQDREVNKRLTELLQAIVDGHIAGRVTVRGPAEKPPAEDPDSEDTAEVPRVGDSGPPRELPKTEFIHVPMSGGQGTEIVAETKIPWHTHAELRWAVLFGVVALLVLVLASSAYSVVGPGGWSFTPNGRHSDPVLVEPTKAGGSTNDADGGSDAGGDTGDGHAVHAPPLTFPMPMGRSHVTPEPQ